MKEDVLQVVKECIVESVGVSISEIELHSQVVNDLGADSLDLVELMYLLETRFSISLQRGAIMERIRGVMKEEAFIDQMGHITDAGKQMLRTEIPELAQVEFAPETTINMVLSYFTVEVFVNLIERALEGETAAREALP